MSLDYDAACKAAATRQGLDPVVERLTADGFPVGVEQTGGFCMVVTVTMGGRVYCVTRDGQDETRPYLLGTYAQEAWHDTGDEALDYRYDLSLDDITAALTDAATEKLVAMIEADEKAGQIPPRSEWRTFAGLQNHIDANEYLPDVVPLPEDGNDLYFDLMNKVITAADERLAATETGATA